MKDDGAIIPFSDCIVIAIHDFSQWIISWGASIAMSGSKKGKKKPQGIGGFKRHAQTARLKGAFHPSQPKITFLPTDPSNYCVVPRRIRIPIRAPTHVQSSAIIAYHSTKGTNLRQKENREASFDIHIHLQLLKRSTTSPLNDFAEIEKEKAKWNFTMIYKDLIVEKQNRSSHNENAPRPCSHFFFFFFFSGREKEYCNIILV